MNRFTPVAAFLLTGFLFSSPVVAGTLQRCLEGANAPMFFLPFGLITYVIPGLLTSTTAQTMAQRCREKYGLSAKEFEQLRFASVNIQNLARDAARGGGDYLFSLSTLMECPASLYP